MTVLRPSFIVDNTRSRWSMTRPPGDRDLSSLFWAEESIGNQRYKILTQIGAGGMGRIYLAHDLKLGRRVAIKLIREELVDEHSILERFWTEARAAAAIEHPNIVKVFELSQTEKGLPFLVMEALNGQDLRAELQKVGRLPLIRAIDITGQILFALAATHRVGIVHRDLKPSNIFLTKKEVACLQDLDRSGGEGNATVKLLDFGISRFLQQPSSRRHYQTGIRDVLGTVKYMAPEQLNSSCNVDGRADLYSVAVIFYECVTGQSPFSAEGGLMVAMNRVFQRPIEPIPIDIDGIPTALNDVFERALAQEPCDRYPDAASFIKAIQPFYSVAPEEQSQSIDFSAEQIATMEELESQAFERLPQWSSSVTTLSLRLPACNNEPVIAALDAGEALDDAATIRCSMPCRKLRIAGTAVTVLVLFSLSSWLLLRSLEPSSSTIVNESTVVESPNALPQAATSEPIITSSAANDASSARYTGQPGSDDGSITVLGHDTDQGASLSLAKAAEHADRGTFEPCLEILKAVTPSTRAARLRKRCIAGVRRQTFPLNQRIDIEQEKQPDERPDPENNSTRPSAEKRKTPNIPFLRDAPW